MLQSSSDTVDAFMLCYPSPLHSKQKPALQATKDRCTERIESGCSDERVANNQCDDEGRPYARNGTVAVVEQTFVARGLIV
jgi:hypothetical protein